MIISNLLINGFILINTDNFQISFYVKFLNIKKQNEVYPILLNHSKTITSYYK